MTCWPGERLWLSASPLNRSRTASRKARTTPSSTSASKSARELRPGLFEVGVTEAPARAQRRAESLESFTKGIKHEALRLALGVEQ